MNVFETVFLGIIQGLTEFLPVSSSGHLVIFQNLLGFQEPELLLDCALHLGTLMAVCLYFRLDLQQMAKEIWHWLRSRSTVGRIEESAHAALALWVMVGTIPTALIGGFFKEPLEGLFGSVRTVGVMLAVTGTIVALSKIRSRTTGVRTRVGLFIALAVGSVQGLAIVPGISRSGATIVCGLLCGLNRDLAARFSFLLSIPAIIGALAMAVTSDGFQRVGIYPLSIGFCSSTLVGIAALRALMGMVRKGQLYYFAPYCWVVGLVVLFVFGWSR